MKKKPFAAIIDTVGDLEGLILSGIKPKFVICTNILIKEKIYRLAIDFNYNIFFFQFGFLKRVVPIIFIALSRVLWLQIVVSINRCKSGGFFRKLLMGSPLVIRDSLVPHFNAKQNIKFGRILVEKEHAHLYEAKDGVIIIPSKIDLLVDYYFPQIVNKPYSEETLIIGKNFEKRPNGLERKRLLLASFKGDVIYVPHPRESKTELDILKDFSNIMICSKVAYECINSKYYKNIVVIASSVAWVLSKKKIPFFWAYCTDLFYSEIDEGRFKSISKGLYKIPRISE